MYLFVMEELFPRTQSSLFFVFFPIEVPRFEGDADLHCHWTNGSCAASSEMRSLSLASDVIASSGLPLGTRGDGGRRKHPGQEYAKNELKGKEDAPDAECSAQVLIIRPSGDILTIPRRFLACRWIGLLPF